jgi:hypothetical protein
MDRLGHRGSLTGESFLVAADKTAPGLALQFPGRILANRYKILEVINADAFKAHDRVLDQSVNVTEVTIGCYRDRAFWYQKIRRLTLFRNVHCLNVLDVVREIASDYVITERPRGKTIAELLYERSPFYAEDVPDLIRPLAGAIDLLAVTGAWSSLVSSRLVYAESQYSCAARPQEGPSPDQSQFNQSARFSLKLDVWELVRPRTNNSRWRMFSMVQRLGLAKACCAPVGFASIRTFRRWRYWRS